MPARLLSACFVAIAVGLLASERQQPGPLAAYRTYAGSTHAHTANTWSHGNQWSPGPDTRMSVENGVSRPGPDNVLRPDWQQHQGAAAEHYARARANGYDFYTVTDHSQEATFQPVGPQNGPWRATKDAAAAATDASFVALAGYEHSENDGPGGTGHLNVINSAEYLNALAPGIDLPFLYGWLPAVPADGEGPVVATFNHPGPEQYGAWAGRTSAATDAVPMLEVVNSNDNIHEAGFVAALDAGWKVSPVAGNDNHGLPAIASQKTRTFVLATALTKAAVLEAMKARRTYASLETNLECRYTVNGEPMGSTFVAAQTLQFDIAIADPDVGDPADRITKVEIVGEGGVLATTDLDVAVHSVRWQPLVMHPPSRYYFVRVWNAGGGDVAEPDPSAPVAWLAPVWTER